MSQNTAMVFNQSFLSITPKAFQAIDIDFSIGESSFMINPKMSTPKEHNGVVAFEFICVHNAAPSYHFNSQVKQGLY